MTISFIDPGSYFLTFYIVMVSAALLCLGNAMSSDIGRRGNLVFLRIFGPILILTIISIIGLRPIHYVFDDMVLYNRMFVDYQIGYSDIRLADPLLGIIMYLTGAFSAEVFFFICANIYIWPLYIAYRTWFGPYWPYALLVVACSLSFFSFGVNGIRNGMAASLFICALSRTRKVEIGTLMALSVGFHMSMLLPIGAYIAARNYSNTRVYLFVWLLSIPVSLLFGLEIQEYVGSLGFEDRLSYFVERPDEEAFSSVGFRWDFLIYSAFAIGCGFYYTQIKKYRDTKYIDIFNVYIMCNAFWIIVIQSNFSNRIAYLSWMILDLVLVFPLLRVYIIRRQLAALSVIALLNALLAIYVVTK